MKTKKELIKIIRWCEDTPPSKWDPSVVFRFKRNALPSLKELVENMEDIKSAKKDIVDIAKEIFK